MVKLNKIYTRSGDKGTTVLVTGERVEKHHLRIAAYGTVDEANSAVGMARVTATGKLDDMLARIQNDCFDLGSDLGTVDPEDGSGLGYEPLRIVQEQVDRLEREIDELNAELEPLSSFVLPGGSPTAANLHLARTISRRAERIMVEATATETISEAALKYINRLSDFLFVAARYANDKGASDVLWVPGANR
jgi:cob(I)alamin adenosyltransferase